MKSWSVLANDSEDCSGEPVKAISTPATEYMQCSLSNIQGMSANENYHVVIPALVYEVKLIWRKFQDPVEASKAMLRM